MQNLRVFLFATLGALMLLLWNAWQEDYGPAPVVDSDTEQPVATNTDSGRDTKTQPTAPAPDASTTAESEPGTPATGRAGQDADASNRDTGQPITVVTDLLDLEIDSRGGEIGLARLRKHTISAEDDTPSTLLTRQSPLFVAQVGMAAEQGEAPNHNAEWQFDRREYRLAEGEDRLVVPLTWTSPDGVTVIRRYILNRDSYVIDVEQEIDNGTAEQRRFYQYFQLRREVTDSGQTFLGARSYTGGIVYTPQDHYQKYGFDDIAESDLSRDVNNGWVAMIQHYFLAAIIPPRDTTERFYTRSTGNERIIGMSSPWRTVAADSSTTLTSRLFVGPKEQDRLGGVVKGLELTVDYGWFTILSKPLFIVLSWIHSVVGNWGWSIVLLVLLLKLVFFKLSETSYKSMARMRKLQPKMQEIKERHSDDKQRMNQEVMEMYKREKVNPLGGCLPIVVQIPVFISLYWVLLESVELRQAPWILWIHDLAIPDPYYVLPVLMGLTMLIQQRLNPAPMDPIQQKVMMALPVVFSVFFLFFPAGLVIYWVTNNSLSILQQWLITRRIEAGDDDKPADRGRKKSGKAAKTQSAKGKLTKSKGGKPGG